MSISFHRLERARNPGVAGFGRKANKKPVRTQDTPAVTNLYAGFEGEDSVTDYEALARDLGVIETRDGKIVTRRPSKKNYEFEVVYANDSISMKLLVGTYNLDRGDLINLGADHLGVIVEACKAAVELGLKPSEIGVDKLFRDAGELQAQVEEKLKTKPKPAIQALGTPARTISATPATESVTTPKVEKPEGSDWLGRIKRGSNLLLQCTCGCNIWMIEAAAKVPGWQIMQDELGRRPEIWDLHAFVRAPGHHNGRGYSFMETVAISLDREAELDGNNTLLPLLDGEGSSHRLSHFMVPLPSGSDAGKVAKLMDKRNKLPSEWDELRALIGLGRGLAQVLDTRIPKWEAEGRMDVVDLRVFASMHHRQVAFNEQRRANQIAYEARQARREANDSSEMSFGDEDSERSGKTAARKRAQLKRKRENTPPAHNKRR